MSWVTSPACTELETLMLDWIRELLGLPDAFHSTSANGGGVIQGTASEATLVAILSARFRATSGVVNADGDTSRLVAYATSQAHSSIEKGLRIAGIGTDRLRVVPHDDAFAMRPDALAEMIDRRPGGRADAVLRVRHHGTTSSMAFDPTAEIADLPRADACGCTSTRRWPGSPPSCPSIAGSTTVSGGPTATAPTRTSGWASTSTATCSGPPTAAALLGALSILPEYLRSSAAEANAVIDYRDWQVPLGRRFRALKLWFTIRLDGVESFHGR